MDSALMKVFDDVQHEYPNADQVAHIRTLAASVPLRVEAAQAFHALEDVVADATVSQLRTRFPDFEKTHPNGWQKGLDDFAMVSRTCIQAMLLDDMESLDEKLLYWFRDIVEQVKLPKTMIRQCHELFHKEYQKRSDPSHYQLLEPFLTRSIDLVCSDSGN